MHASCTRGHKYHHSSCVTEEGKLYSWGSAYKGKLGNTKSWSHSEPTHIKVPEIVEIDFKVKKTICGGIHHSLIDENDTLYTFGCGSDG